MQLLNRDVVTIHEEVQQIDSKMSGGRAESEAVAHDGNQISKIPSETQLRGLALVRRQLQLLKQEEEYFIYGNSLIMQT